jgi:hypothetical protein
MPASRSSEDVILSILFSQPNTPVVVRHSSGGTQQHSKKGKARKEKSGN